MPVEDKHGLYKANYGVITLNEMHHSTCNFFQEFLKKGLDAKKDHFFSALDYRGLLF